MRGSDRMHALYLHFTDAPLSDYARAENHSAALAFRIVWKSCIENIRAVHELSNFYKDPEFAVIVKIGLWPR